MCKVMRGLCKIGCGGELEYESHEFSDGFVYYLPRNLDGTVHDCFIANNYQKKLEDGTFKNIFDCFRKNGITEKDAEDILLNDEYRFEGLEDVHDENDIDMILNGKTDEAIKRSRFTLNEYPNPFGQGKTGYYDYELKIWFPTPADMNISSPTVWGYQLEHLGKLYEIITNFDDAKKCYDLQYECTGEAELLEKSKELDKKIKEENEINISIKNIPDDIPPNLLKNTIDETEEKLRQYVVALFSNDMNKIWKRLPWLDKQIREIRKKEQESIIPIEDKTDVERLSLGMLITILKESLSEKKSRSNGKCEKCGKMWKKNDYVFLSTKSKENERLICSNEVCFKDQGGLVSDVNLSFLNYIYIVREARNAYSHMRNYDQEMLQNVFKTAMSACVTVNKVIEDYLDKKELV